MAHEPREPANLGKLMEVALKALVDERSDPAQLCVLLRDVVEVLCETPAKARLPNVSRLLASRRGLALGTQRVLLAALTGGYTRYSTPQRARYVAAIRTLGRKLPVLLADVNVRAVLELHEGIYGREPMCALLRRSRRAQRAPKPADSPRCERLPAPLAAGREPMRRFDFSIEDE